MKPIKLATKDFIIRVGDVLATHTNWTIKSKRPCIVLFTASACDACQIVKPVLRRIAFDLIAHVDFYEVDLDQAPELEEALDIRRVPTLLFCNPSTDMKASLIGSRGEDDLRDLIDEFLLAKRA